MVQAIQGKPNPERHCCLWPCDPALLGLSRFVKWQEHFMSQMTVFRDTLGRVQPNREAVSSATLAIA